jgi:rhamnose transport system permease protein
MGFLIGIGAGAAAGCVNAMLVNGLRIHSIIATLATLSIFRGIVFVVSDGRQISADELPPALLGLAGAGAVPTILLLSLAPAIAAHLLLTRTAFGRQLFAIGSNAEAAALRGLPVHRATGWAFVLSGAAAGFAGVVYAARFGVVNPSSAGTGFELAVIAAVILGGASISGGVGSAVGTVLGVMLIALIEISLPALGVPHVWQGVIFGAVIVAALLIDRATRGVEQPP